MIANTEYQLNCKKSDLEKAMKTATYGIKKKTAGGFLWIYAGGRLTLRGPMAEESIEAEGNWPVAVSMSPQFAKNLAKALPATDPLHIRFGSGKLFIEKFSLPAQEIK